MTLYNHYMKANNDQHAMECVKQAIGREGVVACGFSLGFSSNQPLVILTMPEGADPHSVLPDLELDHSISLEDLLAEQKAEDANNNEQPEQTQGE